MNMASLRRDSATRRLRGSGNALARSIAAVAIVCGVAACGFHLRGEANFPFTSVYISSPTTTAMNTALQRSLEGAGSATVVGAADKAQVVLELNSVEDDKHILSLSSGGKVFEYLLTKRVLFRVHDADGNDWLPTSEVVIRRTYTYSDTEVLAKAYQEERLWREMQTDAVQQIVRRLQTAKKPVA